ncbi:hypothetical protein Vafri_11823 [Volvox africanus]|uniref:Uncharacterized protein n=1 Tax=Volvox africanus TaxID=51714 RepID=A0A8J4B8V9_9CHLO|nr:hypothetical protein Vafri_11823 [Volvox africanus]
MASYGEVGAVISGLESEYIRSRKFLADLCRSLEKRGILKPSDRIEDSSVATKHNDIPDASTESKDVVNPFANFDLEKESSETSVCSECSTSSPQLAGDLHPEPPCSKSYSQSPGYGLNDPIINYGTGDASLAAATSSPARNRHTSGRIYKKPSVAFTSPATESLSQDYTCPHRFTAAHSCNQDHASGLQHRHSLIGAGSSTANALFPEGPPSLAHVLVTPLQIPRSGARHRRSSLDFIPAPPAHLRKWLDATASPCQQQQATTPPSSSLSLSLGAAMASLSPPLTVPSGNATHERPYQIRRRSSLEVLGCSAATSPANLSNAVSAATPVAMTFSGSSAVNLSNSPSAGCSSGCGGGVSILSRPCLAMSNMKRGNHPLPQQQQQQQAGLQQQQPQQQQQEQQQCEHSPSHSMQQPPQQPLAMESSPGVTAPAASCSSPQVPAPPNMDIERSASAGGGQSGFGLGSPAGNGSNHLPPLHVAISATLPTALSCPGAKGGVAELGGSGIGGRGSSFSGPLSSGATIIRRSSFSGRPPSGCGSAAPASVLRPTQTVLEFSPGGSFSSRDTRVRSGRFSRCSMSSVAIATAADTAGTSANASAVATALLNHGHAARDKDRRSISSGEVSERLIPRLGNLMFTGINLVDGGGADAGRGSDGGGGGGPPLSTCYTRRDSGLSCSGGEVEAHATPCNGGGGASVAAAAAAATAMTASSFAAAITTAAAAAATRLQHMTPVLISPRRSEATRTRPGPSGQQR